MHVDEYPILVEQLCPGLFVRLDTAAGIGPLSKRTFKITSEEQIEEIRRLGITYVICISDKSDRLPISLEELERKKNAARPGRGARTYKTPVSLELLGLKRETIARNKERRERFAACEKRYDEAVSQVVGVLKKAAKPSEEVLDAARGMISSLVDTFLSDLDVVVSLMTTKPREETRNYHALNVTVLSLMLARELGLGKTKMNDLGMGALFHDVGKGRVPIQRFSKGNMTTLNKVVREYYREHPVLGAKLVSAFPDFPPDALDVVLKHHETLDGQGFPAGLSGDDVPTLARIAAVADTYDTLCNRRDEAGYATPHEALKAMYGKKTSLDQMLLATFIRNIGVYPPGSLVELSNGLFGMVVSSSPKASFRPSVLVHHPDIPRKEALVIDLTIEEDVKIARALRPDDLPREVFAYLNPVRRANYYVDALPPA
jgi:putative nucleotidyltransferase with HDIG domain